MENNKTALFIVPRSSGSWEGSEALWITIAGWSAAAKKRFGKAFILTTDRIAEPHEVLDYPRIVKKQKTSALNRALIKRFPKVLKTFVKDILLWKSANNKTQFQYELPDFGEVCFVWEHHDLFPGIGYDLAKKYKAPFIKYVHAPQVWEAKKWGVKRPLWGRYLEALEADSLKKADVVASVSQKVSEKLIQMGVSEKSLLISPMAIDPVLFQDLYSSPIFEKYQLDGKFVIGWIGSFRSFHGLDLLLKTFKIVTEQIKNARLMLVGDGLEKVHIEKLAKTLNIEDYVIFPGRKSFTEIPLYINTFNLAIVSASKTKDFHYSPLKLREYLGAGKTTMAPNAGEIPEIFSDNKHLKLYNIGEMEETAKMIIDLANSANERRRLAKYGKEFVLENSTWAVELEKVLKKIESI